MHFYFPFIFLLPIGVTDILLFEKRYYCHLKNGVVIFELIITPTFLIFFISKLK